MTDALTNCRWAIAHIDSQIAGMNGAIDGLRESVDALVDVRIDLLKVCKSLEAVTMWEIDEQDTVPVVEPEPEVELEPEPEEPADDVPALPVSSTAKRPTKPEPGEPEFACEHCDKRFWKRSGLAIHVGRVHLGQSAATRRNPNASAPALIEDLEVEPITGKAFECSSCDHRSALLRGIIRHTRSQHGRDSYASERMPVSA